MYWNTDPEILILNLRQKYSWQKTNKYQYIHINKQMDTTKHHQGNTLTSPCSLLATLLSWLLRERLLVRGSDHWMESAGMKLRCRNSPTCCRYFTRNCVSMSSSSPIRANPRACNQSSVSGCHYHTQTTATRIQKLMNYILDMTPLEVFSPLFFFKCSMWRTSENPWWSSAKILLPIWIYTLVFLHLCSFLCCWLQFYRWCLSFTQNMGWKVAHQSFCF